MSDIIVKDTSRLNALVKRTHEDRVKSVVADFYASLTSATIAGYRQDLRHFAAFVGLDVTDAVQQLFASSNGVANEACIKWKDSMVRAAPATINRRLSALRSLVRFGRMLGLIQWSIDVRGVKSKAYRDTAGPGIEAVRAMIAEAENQNSSKAIRDVALLRLLFALGLRSIEIRELDIDHVDLKRGLVFIRGKGQSEREGRTMPKDVATAVARWLSRRESCSTAENGQPLFLSSRGRRFSRVALWKLVSRLGAKVGVKTWPHGLRHTAITEALNITGGNVRDSQKFSRHSRPETLMKYDDARVDAAGNIAEKLESRLRKKV